jgi:hypothetical protein
MESFNKIEKTIKPYEKDATNMIYNLLFCDQLSLYRENTKPPYKYPFDILFSANSSIDNLKNVISDSTIDSRIKILAYNKLSANGYKSDKKELLAVIVELGLDDGLDVLASFSDGKARYINQTGKILIWETTDDNANKLTEDLFVKSEQIVSKIGPWNKPRRPYPTKGNLRITFLVSDGLYFGEAPINILFNDPLASPALLSATNLMKYITEKSLEKTN